MKKLLVCALALVMVFSITGCSGGAKFVATLYLIGTICFPVYLLFGLPITIVGFIGSGKQKRINNTTIAM